MNPWYQSLLAAAPIYTANAQSPFTSPEPLPFLLGDVTLPTLVADTGATLTLLLGAGTLLLAGRRFLKKKPKNR